MLLIVGCGYVGQYVRKILSLSMPILATSRTVEGSLANGWWSLNLDQYVSWPDLNWSEVTVLYSVPPSRDSKYDHRVRVVQDSLRNHPPKKVIYLSTTGIYGDCGGQWVDEAYSPSPSHQRHFARLDAELAWRDFAKQMGCELAILRLAGIYGPGRTPISKWQDNRSVVCREESHWVNHVAVHDIVAVIEAVLEHHHGIDCYNVADGHPMLLADWYDYWAAILGLAQLPKVSKANWWSDLSDRQRSFVASRRVDVARVCQNFNLSFKTLDVWGPKYCQKEDD